MRRNGLALAAALGLLGLLFAGAARAERTYFIETRGGFDLARWTGSDANQINGTVHSKTGMALGVALQVPLNARFTLEPELSYVMKGTSFGMVTDPTYGTRTYSGTFNQLWAVDYLELPVLLRANLGRGFVRPALLAGPFGGWKMLEKQHLRGSTTGDYAAKSDDMRVPDFGLTGGVGCEVGHPENCITFQVRYTTSLLNVQRPQFDGTLHNSDVRFLVGWKQYLPGPLEAR